MCALHTCARLGSRKKWHGGASINDVCKISCINWIPSPPLSAFHTTCKMCLSAKSAFPQPPPRSAVQTPSFMDGSPPHAMRCLGFVMRFPFAKCLSRSLSQSVVLRRRRSSSRYTNFPSNRMRTLAALGCLSRLALLKFRALIVFVTHILLLSFR